MTETNKIDIDSIVKAVEALGIKLSLEQKKELASLLQNILKIYKDPKRALEMIVFEIEKTIKKKLDFKEKENFYLEFKKNQLSKTFPGDKKIFRLKDKNQEYIDKKLRALKDKLARLKGSEILKPKNEIEKKRPFTDDETATLIDRAAEKAKIKLDKKRRDNAVSHFQKNQKLEETPQGKAILALNSILIAGGISQVVQHSFGNLITINVKPTEGLAAIDPISKKLDTSSNPTVGNKELNITINILSNANINPKVTEVLQKVFAQENIEKNDIASGAPKLKALKNPTATTFGD